MTSVLIIDDDDDIRTIASVCLERIGGMKVWTAPSAQLGMESARANRPDVILLDVMMPEMDGVTALGLMRNDPDLKDMKVIFITARVQRTDLMDYFAQGAIGVVHKPFDPLNLPGEILEILKTC
jgi:CheY-like chemotaxis protein